MLTPEYLLHISEGAEQIAEELHNDIVNRIVKAIMIRLDRGDDYKLTARDKWMIEVLQDAGYLREDIEREIAKKTGLQQTEIREAMEDACVTNMRYEDDLYKMVNIIPGDFTQSPYMMRLMQRAYEATLGEWTNLTRTTAEAAQQSFISACDRAYNLVSSGAVSYTEAVKDAVESIVKDGVKVVYPSGHTDTIETATLRAVRTGVSQATAHITEARMDEFGEDLVLVSAHLGARPEHYVWQGKVYSRSGTNPKYPDFKSSTRYGEVDGLCGANCRHNFSVWFEGAPNPFEHFDEEENRKRYEIEQRQRAMERRIRNTKRETMGLKTAMDNAQTPESQVMAEQAYQKKAALLQKQNAAYKEYCEENNLKELRDRLHVAQWDRKQAAAARGAARKYQNSLENHTENDTIKTGKNLKVKDGDTLVNPMNSEKYSSMKKNLEKQGVHVIQATGDDLRYLQTIGAEASYGNGYIMHIGEIPSASGFFEEIIHATQAKRYGEFVDSDPKELYAREVAANRMLLKNGKLYGFDQTDFEDIRRNLATWEEKFIKEVGVNYDRSNYFRGI